MAARRPKFSTRFSSLIIAAQQSFWSKKLRSLGIFKVKFRTKAAKIRNFGHSNFTFRHYNLSIWAHVSRTYRGKQYWFCFIKTINLIKQNLRELDLGFLPQTELYLRVRILNLDFLQLYLIKLILFIKKNKLACIIFCYRCVKYELIGTHLGPPTWVLIFLPLQWALF